MVFVHDFDRFPELTNNQLNDFEFVSPHVQIKESFDAKVVKVVDGDTIRVFTSFRDFDFPVRLLDIDSPELNEGGEEAKEWLRKKLLGESVHVEVDIENRVDKYGRLLGRVFYNGLDVGQEQIYLGYAVPFGSRSEGRVPGLDTFFRGVSVGS